MVTLRSYQCNFCREEYSQKNSFKNIDDIIGLKWDVTVWTGTPYDKSETIEVLEEVNREEAENHLCRRCLEAIKSFRPKYITVGKNK